MRLAGAEEEEEAEVVVAQAPGSVDRREAEAHAECIPARMDPVRVARCGPCVGRGAVGEHWEVGSQGRIEGGWGWEG